MNTGQSLQAPAVRAVRPRQRIRWRQQLPAWLFLLPALVVFAYVTWYPMLVAVGYSFQHVTLTGATSWAGLDNYTRMLSDPLFYQAWRNTIEFALLSIVMAYLLPLAVALMIHELRRMSGLFQLLFYLPTLIPITIALLVWRQIYAPEGGLLNSLLIQIGGEPQLWLQSIPLVKPSMVAIMTWAGAGGTVLIYLAALRDVPLEIYEAAELDGFTPWQRMQHIALPSLASKMHMLLVLQVIFVMQVFAEPLLLTEGGPANASVTPALASYRAAFALNDFGLAATWSMSLLLVLSLFSIVYVWVSREESKG